MPTLSQAQVAMYAQSAGLSADRARIAAAIAMAESGGRTTAHNAVPPDDSYGLWQINMIGSMGPGRRRSLGISSNTALYDPATNARAMAQISNGGSNFSPWSTYTSGAYESHMDGSVTPADSYFGIPLPDGVPNPLEVLPGVQNVANALSGINAMAELAVGLARWTANPHNWIRTVEVGVGAILVGVGLAVMTRGTWQPAVSAAQKVATFTPAGRLTATAGARKTANVVRSGGRGVKPAPKPKPAAKKTAPPRKVAAAA